LGGVVGRQIWREPGWPALGWPALGWPALGWPALGTGLAPVLVVAPVAVLALVLACWAPATGSRARPSVSRVTVPAAQAGVRAGIRPGDRTGLAPPRGSAACAAFRGARQLTGADGVTPAAWSDGGLVVPVCGPVPGDGTRGAAVYAYPGALWTAGYQCVEFSERYLYARYGITMNVLTNGDQVAAHYAADFPALFTVVRNGTPHRPPAGGDVLSLSAAPAFDSPSGGHTAVVESSAVDGAGNGTVTVVEENGSPSGVEVLTVARWTVRYPGYRYIEWLAATGRPVTSSLTKRNANDERIR
jgi:hypothetical protein